MGKFSRKGGISPKMPISKEICLKFTIKKFTAWSILAGVYSE